MHIDLEFWLCDDCTIWVVNADSSGMDDDRAQEVMDAVADLGTHLVPHFDSSTGEGIEEFSGDNCECCGAFPGSRNRFATLVP